MEFVLEATIRVAVGAFQNIWTNNGKIRIEIADKDIIESAAQDIVSIFLSENIRIEGQSLQIVITNKGSMLKIFDAVVDFQILNLNTVERKRANILQFR